MNIFSSCFGVKTHTADTPISTKKTPSSTQKDLPLPNGPGTATQQKWANNLREHYNLEEESDKIAAARAKALAQKAKFKNS